MRVLLVATFLAIAHVTLAWNVDCNNVDQAAKTYVEKQITENSVYILGSSYDTLDYVMRMGFDKKDIVVDDLEESVDGRPDHIALLNYVFCSYSQSQSVPQVFIGKRCIGGLEETRRYYYTGAGSTDAYNLASLDSYNWYQEYLKMAARDFVDEGTHRSLGMKYFVLTGFSKRQCPLCNAARECFRKAGVPASDMETYYITYYDTYDEIQKYNKELTGTSDTPLIAFNGKVLYSHKDLINTAGC